MQAPRVRAEPAMMRRATVEMLLTQYLGGDPKGQLELVADDRTMTIRPLPAECSRPANVRLHAHVKAADLRMVLVGLLGGTADPGPLQFTEEGSRVRIALGDKQAIIGATTVAASAAKRRPVVRNVIAMVGVVLLALVIPVGGKAGSVWVRHQVDDTISSSYGLRSDNFLDLPWQRQETVEHVRLRDGNDVEHSCRVTMMYDPSSVGVVCQDATGADEGVPAGPSPSPTGPTGPSPGAPAPGAPNPTVPTPVAPSPGLPTLAPSQRPSAPRYSNA